MQGQNIHSILVFYSSYSYEEEKTQAMHMNDQLKQRLDNLTVESENLSDERLKLLEEIDDIKNTLTDAQKEVATRDRKHSTQVSH